MNNKEKTFVFKYDSTISLKQMGEEMLEAVRTGKSSINQHQISFANIRDIIAFFKINVRLCLKLISVFAQL